MTPQHKKSIATGRYILKNFKQNLNQFSVINVIKNIFIKILAVQTNIFGLKFVQRLIITKISIQDRNILIFAKVCFRMFGVE